MPPILGREFVSSDGLFGRQPEPVLVLSYRFWKAHYAGDRHVIGKVLQLDRENYTVIGILPRTFTWFHRDVYVPMNLTPDPNRVAMIDARLKAGVTPTAAEAGLYSLIQSFQRETPAHFPRQPRLMIRSVNSATEDRFRGPLFVLFAAVSLLRLVGVANVSLLLMARATARQHELAMRSSLGADRLRILQQLFTEAFILAGAGCLLGIGLAYAGVPLVIRWLPADSFPNEAAIRIHIPVLVFSSVVSLIAGLACGLWPAFSASRPDLSQTLQANTQKAFGTRKGRRLRVALIATQVALTFVLLAGTGSAIRTFLKLYLAPLGYDPSHLLTIGLQLPDGTHLQLKERQRFYSAVRQAIAELPGVLSAAIDQSGFPPQDHFSRKLELYDQPTATGLNVNVNPISREFFQTLKIPLLRGSVWSEHQTQQASGVAVVNQAFARRYYLEDNPVGKRVRLPDFTAFTSWMLAHKSSNQWLSIAGVVGDTPNEGLSKPAMPAVYVPYSLVLGDSLSVAIRANGDSSMLLHSIRQAIHRVDATQPVNDSRTAERILSDYGWATERFVASLFFLFSALALALAAVGLFSVISFLVAGQYQEFGVRMALGASRARVVFEVLLSGTSAVTTGLAAGCVLCAFANRQVQTWTNGSLYDPIVMLCVSCVLLFVSAVASFFPAWRAGNVEPVAALRHG